MKLQGPKCGKDKGMLGLCTACDVCTPTGDVKSTQEPFSRCPKRNYNYGRNTLGPATSCLPCSVCTAPNTYSRVNAADNFCYTDQAGKECILQFFDWAKEDSLDNAVVQQADSRNNGLVIQGTMPFKAGWQRNKGIQHKSGPPDGIDINANIMGFAAVLPYYSQCPSAIYTLPNAVTANYLKCTAGAELRCPPTGQLTILLLAQCLLTCFKKQETMQLWNPLLPGPTTAIRICTLAVHPKCMP